MSDHVPFPEDDRSTTPYHGDALLRASFDKRCVDLGEPGHEPPSVDVELESAVLGCEIALVDSCPACWQRTFCDAPPCSRHDV
jgi:hypothetical protein